MEKLKFRRLNADEIDCRISTVNENGLSLLLYKDARCDMNILDETVGPMNWKREHSRNNANCTVSIWDNEKGMWVSKEDTGTESYTEKEKGLASDSFKRACFNWGIGRELYTAPFIWIPRSDCQIKESEYQGKKKYTSYDHFEVTKLGCDDNGRINELEIKNEKTHKVVFCLGEKRDYQVQDRRINGNEIYVLQKEAERTGMNLDKALKKKGLNEIGELPLSVYESWMKAMKSRESIPHEAPKDGGYMNIPDTDDGLPWAN